MKKYIVLFLFGIFLWFCFSHDLRGFLVTINQKVVKAFAKNKTKTFLNNMDYYYVIKWKCYGATNPYIYVDVENYKWKKCIFLNRYSTDGDKTYLNWIYVVPETDKRNYNILSFYNKNYVKISWLIPVLDDKLKYNYYCVPKKIISSIDSINFDSLKYRVKDDIIQLKESVWELWDFDSIRVISIFGVKKEVRTYKPLFIPPLDYDKNSFTFDTPIAKIFVSKVNQKLEGMDYKSKKTYLNNLKFKLRQAIYKIGSLVKKYKKIAYENPTIDNSNKLFKLEYIFEVLQIIKEKVDNIEIKPNTKFISNVGFTRQFSTSIWVAGDNNSYLSTLERIREYLSSHKYSKFDKTVLKVQQKILSIIDNSRYSNKWKKITGNIFLNWNNLLQLVNINNLLVWHENSKSYISWDVLFSGYLNLNTVFESIISWNYAFVNFSKFILNWQEPYSNYYGKYIRFLLNSNRLSYKGNLDIKRLIETEPLFREIPWNIVGYTGYNIIVPNLVLDRIVNKIWHYPYTTMELYVRNLITNKFWYYTYSNYKYDIKSHNIDGITWEILLQDDGQLKQVKFGVNDTTYIVILSENAINLKISWNNELQANYSNTTNQFLFKVNGTFEKFSVNVNISYNKYYGNTKITWLVENNGVTLFTLNGSWILKEWKNNFTLGGYISSFIPKLKFSLAIKDTKEWYDSYREKLSMKITGYNDFNLNYDLLIKNTNSVNIPVPKNFIDEKQLTNSFLLSYQARAYYDVVRKANLNEIYTALILYFNDNWEFPDNNKVYSALIPAYMADLPKDPFTHKDYFYMPLSLNGANAAWAILGAKMFLPENCNTPFTSEKQVNDWIKENKFKLVNLQKKLEKFKNSKSNFPKNCYYVKFVG